jgi:calcineurin-like phosphoesterase family protein
MIYFTADTHINHRNIINLCDRPFRDENGEPDVVSMDDTLIKNWNSIVTSEDEVYLLGDFAFTGVNKLEEILNTLNGKIYFIWGNHDNKKHILRLKNRFEWIKDYHTMWYFHDDVKYHFVLFHYPITSWDRMYHGSIHLHGHQHIVDQIDRELKIYDVGVDGNGFKPVSIVDIINLMNTKNLPK